MGKIGILKNRIQEYAWGSKTAIPALLGETVPSEKPVAEIWMGAHSKAPSLVYYENRMISLDQLIRKDPVNILGKKVAERFNDALPFLFKVLAAAEPLSIQAHPDREHAIKGFERENRLQIPLDAHNRNYRDENHKPELICALTPFWVMCGFRRSEDILNNLEMLLPGMLKMVKQHFLDKSGGLKAFFSDLMTLGWNKKQALISDAVKRLETLVHRNAVAHWIIRLHEKYPTDIGIFSPAYLNLIRLDPGQALFLPAGELHAYLEGMGVEVMANSDNVLRGGLTAKHVDVDELLAVLHFEPRRIDILSGAWVGDTERLYQTGAEEFLLSSIHLKKEAPYSVENRQSIEILFWSDGHATISTPANGERLEVCKGMSIMVPASVRGYTLAGDGTVFKVCVPSKPDGLKKSNT